MKSRTKQILAIMNIISWIIFIGICIKTGAILYSFFVSLFINPDAAKNLHMGLNLSSLHQYSSWHYSALMTFIIVLTALKAYLFYLVIRIFIRINFRHPFSKDISSLISSISVLAMSIGILTLIGNGYTDWLTDRGVLFPNMTSYLGGAAEFLLLGGIIFVIAQVFKKGIEIQTENELTV